ncbi:carboxylate-amine ligase [Thermomonospora echinospora]|uniref:Putative glutamate--cysteine ligase 2 n=1 Tax=Thermomonospora echinospora TaxID=1992 RepID=A0A1H5ZWA7_9ACTN|nr:carboxylate--amine ligase/circularly permuted type 2 ATP-grasp protein [Thermomonospora echinospora]SEG40244.1 carboxylate-amine ligase [Thermomonospora echinospora]
MAVERPELVAVGVEEEFHTVDLETHRLRPRADGLLEQLHPDRFVAELQRSVVETNSRPFVRLADLAEDLAALRRRVVEAAEPLGLGIVAAGTVPLVDLDALKVTPDERYENMLEEYQQLTREQLICGAQVHVDAGDRDMAVAVAHRIGPWLPPLLALSASSPYWLGTDTGYASYRTLLWQRWPTTGPLGAFASAEEYDRMLADLVRSGVISDPGMAYFDVRPSAHLPTVELRVCDACPRVEDVVLLAGLFRALVIREMDAVAAGEPAAPVRTELVRAATWRAARSGLDGELVDPRSGVPVPAGELLRGLLDDLRPMLERTGDWELVAEMTEGALTRGDSAARQRAAFAVGGMDDVVELLLAETRANTEWAPGPPRRSVTRMTADYRTESDEAVVFDGSARAPYEMIMAVLDRLGADGLRERERERDEVQRRLGMTFRVAGEEEERLFPFDLVPRVIAAEDWRPLQAGLRQRVRALEAFLHDAYGERAAVRDGVLPAWAIDDSPGLRPEGRRVPRSAVRCAVAGLDLVRDGAGRWVVLEDNLRVPSGIGYAMANRWLTTRVLPELVRTSRMPPPSRAVAVLRAALTSASPALAVVTSGERDSAFYEHRMLAREMGVPLVTPDRLVVTGDGVRIDGPEGAHVEVLYRRVGEDELFDAVGPGLLEAMERGAVTLANAPGNGVGDDKALYVHVPRLIEYYLGERPLLDNVTTYLCRDPDQRAEALDRLKELVIKPVDGYGGSDVLIGPEASAAELAEARERILAEPARWIAQETVELSTHPTFVDGRLEPRAVDLRAFVVQGPEPVVVPLALTRVAPASSRIVNSSQGGGSKDTWLMR